MGIPSVGYFVSYRIYYKIIENKSNVLLVALVVPDDVDGDEVPLVVLEEVELVVPAGDVLLAVTDDDDPDRDSKSKNILS